MQYAAVPVRSGWCLLARTLVRSIALLIVVTGTAVAYPDRPVVIISPLAAGGANDIIARLLAQELTKRLGQQVLVENRTGASGNLGTQAGARSAADGYTLLLAPAAPVVINQNLYPNLGYDPAKDLVPVALVANIPVVLEVNLSVPAKNLQELIELARQHPGKLSFGTPGVGSVQHLAGELLKSRAKIDIVHVPYRGGALAMNDLLGEHISMMLDGLPGSISQIGDRRVRPIAIAGSKRSEQIPEVLTVAEQGFPGYDASTWFALFVPSRTSPMVVKRLTDETVAILKLPDFAAQLRKIGAEPGLLSGDALAEFIGTETEKWARVITAAGVKAE